MRGPDELRALVEEYLTDLALTPELGGLEEPVRYALAGGGKRIRPALCLATGEALARDPEELLPAGAAVELVHTFSLVHDDLPALDDDETRRGRPSVWARYGQGVAVIAGDALLAEAFRLALSYSTPAVARELAGATLGMIGGQHLDLSEPDADATELNRLKTGQLFGAAIGCALRVAELPERDHAPWRAFAAELGLLFQAVDDVLDGDGLVLTHGLDGARALADEAAVRARAHLAELDANTSVLAELTDEMAARTS
jgi:geranylgeranyl diphosphate synthase, type II